ncbi:cyclic nucleotide-binding domain-containing protein [Desulforhopalus sp. IMCC35007]|uniref:cyclic nucleotide-binding domain-containing protein n=1 Tax=Desulforhopalus sp. IMCC35007 TaxID=2569543 RepID=UPI0010AE88BE|nr:cyclic nucleotide-binding domain-containing protein [Desulforhopalus sp. IMCC35007]TKB10305.1 cyclic nucleotide-binding domain-containing protein [Desulforhopalus sp. IMCC35007]
MSHQTLSESEEETRGFLIHLPVFSSFSLDELSVLAKHMSFVHLQRGEYLFMEGDQGTFMGFVVSGVLEVQKSTSGGERVPLARLTKGSSIGEMAIIDQSVRSATVIAKQATTMVTLTEKGFDLLAEKNPTLGIKVIKKIARLLSLNMRRTSSKLADFLQSYQ